LRTQPGRELASTDPATRAGDETVHLAPACATVAVRFGRISPHFRPRRHLLSATGWRYEMAERFTVWNQITGVSTTAA
jgi:putative transposase